MSYCVAGAAFGADPLCAECHLAWQAQYFGHSALHTLHYTLYTLDSTLHTFHFTLHALHSTLYTLYLALHTLLFTHHTFHFTLCTPHFTLYTSHSALHTLHPTFYTLRSTLHNPHFILYAQHSALVTLTLRTLLTVPHSAFQSLQCTGTATGENAQDSSKTNYCCKRWCSLGICMYPAYFTLRCCSIHAAKIFGTKSTQVYITSFQVTRAQTALGVAQRLVQHRLFFAPKEEAGKPGQRKQIGRNGARKF